MDNQAFRNRLANASDEDLDTLKEILYDVILNSSPKSEHYRVADKLHPQISNG